MPEFEKKWTLWMKIIVLMIPNNLCIFVQIAKNVSYLWIQRCYDYLQIRMFYFECWIKKPFVMGNSADLGQGAMSVVGSGVQ